jgi:hypothetical protein
MNEQEYVSFDLFPTLVIKFPKILNDLEIEKIFKKLKTKECVPDNQLIRGRSSDVFPQHLLRNLGIQKKIQEKLDIYTDRIGILPVRFGNSWFAIQDIGGILKQHYHGGSILSGSLFINVDENSTPIVFDNPNPFNNFLFHAGVQEKLTHYTYNTYEFAPNNGDLIIFPSSLVHGSSYRPNQTKDRMIISFNTYHPDIFKSS